MSSRTASRSTRRDAANGLTASNRGLLDSAVIRPMRVPRVDITIDQCGGTLEVGLFTLDADQPESRGRDRLHQLLPQDDEHFVIAPQAPAAAPAIEPTTPTYDCRTMRTTIRIGS